MGITCHLSRHCHLSAPPTLEALEAREVEPPKVSPNIVSENVKVVSVADKGGPHQPRADAAPEEPLVVDVAAAAPFNKNLILRNVDFPGGADRGGTDGALRAQDDVEGRGSGGWSFTL